MVIAGCCELASGHTVAQLSTVVHRGGWCYKGELWCRRRGEEGSAVDTTRRLQEEATHLPIDMW